MRTVFVIIIGLFFSYQAFCQNDLCLQKAILKNHSLYLLEILKPGEHLGYINEANSGYIRKLDLKQSHPTILTPLYQQVESPLYHFPISWNVISNYLYSISYTEGSNRSKPIFELYRTLMNSQDTALLGNQRRVFFSEILDSISSEQERQQYWINESINQEQSLNSKPILPLSALVDAKNLDNEVIPGILSYDFEISKTDRLVVYLRDNQNLIILSYQYPLSYFKPTSWDDWQIIDWYTIINREDKTQLPKLGDLSINESNLHFSAISDSLFFDHEIKVITQGDIVYFINGKHGGIYTISEDRILKIGQFPLESGSINIFGHHLYIQDVDNSQIIFFDAVKFFGKDESLPSFTIISDPDQIRNFFTHHKEAITFPN